MREKHKVMVEARRTGGRLKLTVLNTGIGLNPMSTDASTGQGVGLANVRNRLHLHYGDNQQCSLDAINSHTVLATLRLPLQFAVSPTEKLTRYGV